MAIITVTSLADNTIANDGAITLREAIVALNANDGAGNSDFNGITFDNTNDEIQLTGLTETITLGGTELQITEELTLTGPGADTLTIDANRRSGVLRVMVADAPLTVVGLTLTGGTASGIGSPGDITLIDSTVSGNSAVNGGGIANLGDLTLIDSTVSGNTANNLGGGINSNGVVTLIDSTVSGNTASNFGGGGIFNRGGVTLTNSTVSDNWADDRGGGINSQGDVTLTNSTVSGNSAENGGGIASFGTIAITDSTVSGNSAENGGGIASYGTIAITDSTVSGNGANDKGGGIYTNTGVPLTLSNSTVSGNWANNSGGGIYAYEGTIDNSTITNNTTDANNNGTGDGGGFFSVGFGGLFGPGGVFTIRNSIIAGNTDMGGQRPDVSGLAGINGDNNNILGTATGGIGTIGTGSDTVLNAMGLTIADVLNTTLADNGGSTFTHALIRGSIAIDASGTGATANDQRGFAAVGTRDIGAFEFDPPEIDITGNSVAIGNGDSTPDTADGTDFGSTNIAGGTITRTFTIANQGNVNLTLNGYYDLVCISGPNADDFSVTTMPTATVAAGGDTTFQVTFDPSAIGVRTATVTIENNDSDENPYTFDIQGTGIETPPIVNPPVAPPNNNPPVVPENPVSLPNNNSPVVPENPPVAPLSNNPAVVPENPPSHPNPVVTLETLPNVRLILDQLEIRLPDFPATGTCGNDDDNLLLGDENANALCGLAGNDVIAGFSEADRLDGNHSNDIIFGNTGTDTIDGGVGDDLIFAGQDDDLAIGGEGIDLMVGDFGNDTLDGNAGNDVVFGNAGADILDGDNGDDWLLGGTENDIVIGGAGNDIVRGDLGDDILIGGAGGDRFDFRFGDGIDIIADFTDGVDIIGLLDGLTFADLTIAQVGNDTQMTATGLVVTLQNVNVGAIDSTDFAVL